MEGKRIDGKKIADSILENLRHEVTKNHLHPHLVVFLVGDNPSSQSYIRQKRNAAERIGAKCTLLQFDATASESELKSALQIANKKQDVHGIIIQRPLPIESPISPAVLDTVAPAKDIDGFLPHSQYEVPVARAVITILEQIYHTTFISAQPDFMQWLRNLEIVVLGKGTTAGAPIRTILEKLAIPVIGIDRSTPNPRNLTKKADVIISCVGKRNTVVPAQVKEGVILLSVGLSRGDDGKMYGDYEEDILPKSLFYTPTPGGVGPVNVACLMQNLVQSSKLS